MKYIVLTIILAFTISCKKEEKKQDIIVDSLYTEQPEIIVQDTLGTKTYCYLSVISNDSIFLSFDDNLGTIIGKMRYKNFEKDNSIGEVSGFKDGDTLKLTYEFSSEGATSKRDIFLLQQDNKLLEGIGTIKTEDGHIKYTDESKVTYNTGLKFEDYDCIKTDVALKEKNLKKQNKTN